MSHHIGGYYVILCLLLKTGIIWKDHHEFISGGKDSKLVMHSFKDAVRLCERVNSIAISFSSSDEVGFAINENLELSSHIQGEPQICLFCFARYSARVILLDDIVCIVPPSIIESASAWWGYSECDIGLQWGE